MKIAAFTILLALGGGASASAQDVSPPTAKSGWNVDLSGTVGVSPGLGKATTGLDLSGAFTLVRTTSPDEFSHVCRGLTVVMTTARRQLGPSVREGREQALLIGPRWDAGDTDGSAFIRVLAGVQRMSGFRTQAGVSSSFEKTTLAIGAGTGVEVLGILFDVNWILAPAADESKHRLTFSAGYIWSPRAVLRR